MEDSNPWLAALVEGSDDAIITKTLHGVITSWNPAAERLFGYSAQEAIGQPVAMLLPCGRADEEPRILARIAHGERVDHFETERVRKDGSIVAVSVTISPVRDAGGRIVGASKIARDISERKKADERVQAQLARLFTLDEITRAIGEHQELREIYQVALRAAEERLPLDFACVCNVDDANHRLVVAQLGGRSARLAGAIALSEHAVLPLEAGTWTEWTDGGLVYVRDVRHLDTSLTRRLERGGFGSLVLSPLRMNGRVASLMVAARGQADAFSSTDCEFLLQLGTHVALAARHAQLRASLQQAFDDLRTSHESALRQQRLQALGQMASGIAHDVGNLVFSAAYLTEELKDRETTLSAEGRDGLELVKGCLDDIAAIVQRLRDFYRAREVSAPSEAIDLNAVIHQVVALARPRCAERSARGARVDVQAVVREAVPAVVGSEPELREALINLVFNALDAMPEGGSVRVRSRTVEADEARRLPAAVEVAVEDDGVGMDAETLRRCMEPFYTTKGDAGTGMGLAMVYGAVQRHGADITIDSVPDRGTTVSIRFPRPHAPVDCPERPAAGAAPVLPASRPLRVLLVDDDPLVLETLAHMLQSSGHAMTTATGGRAGIEAFRNALAGGERFDVVVTDLGMPDVDGKLVARAVKRISSGTPIILLTGWGEDFERNAESRHQFDVILAKPTRRGDLEEAIARVTPASETAS